MRQSAVELFLGALFATALWAIAAMFFGEPLNLRDVAGPGATVFAAGMAGWIWVPTLGGEPSLFSQTGQHGLAACASARKGGGYERLLQALR